MVALRVAMCEKLASRLGPEQAFVLELRFAELDDAGRMRWKLPPLFLGECVPIFFVFPCPDNFRSLHFVSLSWFDWFAPDIRRTFADSCGGHLLSVSSHL